MTILAILIAARWIYFASVFCLFGSALFRLHLQPDGLPHTHRATVSLLRTAAPVAALSGIGWLVAILANMTDGFGSVLDPQTLALFFTATQFGPVSILRLALFFALLVVAVMPRPGRRWFTALLAISTLLLVSQAWLGHAAEGGSGPYGTAMIAAYGVHMLTAAAWVGGLPPLLFALAEMRRDDAPCHRGFDLLARFSAMAIAAVVLIVITGIANAGFRVLGSFDKLFDTPYGNTLFTKVAVVAIMLILAYFNRFVAMPRLRIAAAKDVRQIGKLRASIVGELILGVAALGIAAVLGVTPPPQ